MHLNLSSSQTLKPSPAKKAGTEKKKADSQLSLLLFKDLSDYKSRSKVRTNLIRFTYFESSLNYDEATSCEIQGNLHFVNLHPGLRL